jgi:phosphoglycolate phosphatase-like HAD superfamily hydrolase
MIPYKAIIFDWDGVITDSVVVKTEAYAQIFRKYGPEIEKRVAEYHLAHGGVSRFDKFRYFHKEFLGEEISEEKVMELADEFSGLVFQKVADSPFIKGAVETIRKAYEQGLLLFVISGTPIEEMRLIADKKCLSGYFKEILGSPTRKNVWTKYLLDKYALKPKEVLFLGDAEEDRLAAEVNGVDFCYVTGEVRL